MKQVVVAENAFEPASWTSHECEDVRHFLLEHFAAKWPETARIYHKQVAKSCDVTPVDEETIHRLGELEGPFYVVVYPGDPFTIAAVIIGAALVSAAVIYAITPKIPNSAQRDVPTGSPNNELAERQNAPRINQRISDIYGTVRSTPDLIALPYKVFEDNKELEIAFMCIGRGAYDVSDVRDDTTQVSQILGSSVAVFGPLTSPNSGVAQLTIGDPITYPLVSVARSNAVNGQSMVPDDAVSLYGTMRFRSPDKIELLDSSPVFFTDRFVDTDTIQLNVASFFIPSGTPAVITKTVTFNTGPGKANFTGYDPTPDFHVGDIVTISASPYSV